MFHGPLKQARWAPSWMGSTAVVACVVAVGACGSDPGPVDGDGDADGDTIAKPSCGPVERLVYVTTDYTTGAAGLLNLADWTSQPSLITVHSDAVVTCTCGAAVVVERLGGDNLTLLSPSDLSLIDQHSLGARSNPYDAWFEAGVAYVTLYGRGTLVAVDMDSGERLDEVDLTHLADADGNPEAAMLYHDEGTLYVTLQLLDENATLWDPTAAGLIAVVPLEPFELAGTIELEGLNPSTDMIEGDGDGVVYVGAAGTWSDPGDGGIERVDLVAGETEGIIVGSDELGGNIIDFVIVDAELGYAAVNVPNDRDILVSFDPSAGVVTGELAASNSYSFVDLLLDGAGHLLVVDRSPLASGLRVFEVESGRELFEAPVETGLPPFSMCLLPEPE